MSVLTFYDNFRRRIGSLLEGGFTDAVLLVEGVEIPVHKCILAVQSEYFSQLFGPKEGSRQSADQVRTASSSQAITEVEKVFDSNSQAIIEIKDITQTVADNVFQLENIKVEVMRAVLDYFYRGEYNYHDNVETHLLALELAHQCRLRDLEKILIDNLVESISVDNFVEFYNLKMRYKNAKIENSCVSFLKEHGEEIAKSEKFSKLTRDSLLCLLDEESFAAAEIDIFRATERWAGVNKPNKKTVKDIVKKIRLAIISAKDLFDVVKPSKELPSIDILEAIHSIVNEDAATTNFRALGSSVDMKLVVEHDENDRYLEISHRGGTSTIPPSAAMRGMKLHQPNKNSYDVMSSSPSDSFFDSLHSKPKKNSNDLKSHSPFDSYFDASHSEPKKNSNDIKSHLPFDSYFDASHSEPKKNSNDIKSHSPFDSYFDASHSKPKKNSNDIKSHSPFDSYFDASHSKPTKNSNDIKSHSPFDSYFDASHSEPKKNSNDIKSHSPFDSYFDASHSKPKKNSNDIKSHSPFDSYFDASHSKPKKNSNDIKSHSPFDSYFDASHSKPKKNSNDLKSHSPFDSYFDASHSKPKKNSKEI